MSQIGTLVQFALSPESTNGTYAAPISSEFLPNAGGDYDESKDMVDLKAGFGNVSALKTRKKSKAMSKGKILFPLGIKNAGTALIGIFGQNPVTTGTTPKIHDFSVLNTNAHKTYTIQKLDPEIGLRAFAGCMVDNWGIEATANGEFIDMDFELMGSPKESSPSSITPAYDATEDYFTPDMLGVEIADNVAALTGTPNLIEKVSIKGSKNAEQRGSLGTVNLTRTRSKRYSVAGSFDVELSGATDWNYALTSGTKAVRLTFTSGTYTLVITFAEVSFDAPPAANELDGIAVLSRGFVCHDAVVHMTATLTNNVANYPLT